MRVCVVGGTGYTGARLVARLVTLGLDVHVLARRPDAVPAGAVAHPWPDDVGAAVHALAPDAVVHLAAHYVRHAGPGDLPALEAVNVTLGSAVVEGAVAAGAGRLVVASSHHAHGAGGGPANAYGASRRRFEAAAVAACARAGVPLARLIVHDVYGPDDPRRKLVPALVEAARGGAPAPLVPDGDPTDLVHVDDAVAAFARAVAGPPLDGLFAVRGGVVRTPAQVHAALEAALGREVPVVRIGGAPLDRPLTLPWHGPDVPGWTPQVALSDGLRALCDG